jgi:hypothetical protein
LFANQVREFSRDNNKEDPHRSCRQLAGRVLIFVSRRIIAIIGKRVFFPSSK